MGQKIKRFGLGGEERLKKRSQIKKILAHGARYRTPIFDCLYLDNFSNKVAFIVPKRKIKLATQRNLLKRRMREAYRLNKNILTKTGLHMVFFYKPNEVIAFQRIEIAMMNCLNYLAVTN